MFTENIYLIYRRTAEAKARWWQIGLPTDLIAFAKNKYNFHGSGTDLFVAGRKICQSTVQGSFVEVVKRLGDMIRHAAPRSTF